MVSGRVRIRVRIWLLTSGRVTQMLSRAMYGHLRACCLFDVHSQFLLSMPHLSDFLCAIQIVSDFRRNAFFKNNFSL